MSGDEAALVNECRKVAEVYGAFMSVVSQRGGKHSGTSRGYPDCTVILAGEIRFIEFKRPATDEHPKGYLSLAQTCWIAAALEQGVRVEVVDNVDDFVAILNSCRSSHGVRRTWTR